MASSETDNERPGSKDLIRHGYDRFILVGFMGAGKTTVGRLLARELGWAFRDLDEQIEVSTKRSVQSWLAESESTFRAVEARVAKEAMSHGRSVLATGGGWAVQSGNLEEVPETAIVVWLDISPEVALERARASGIVRPLLEVEDPLAEARSLLSARTPSYRRSPIRIDTIDLSPNEVVESIVSSFFFKTPFPSGSLRQEISD